MTAKLVFKLRSALRLRLSLVKLLSPRRVKAALKRRGRDKAARVIAQTKLKTGLALVGLVGNTLGIPAANKTYWWLRPSFRAGLSTENRIAFLCEKHPGELTAFIRRSLSKSTDLPTLIGMARDPNSKAILKECLLEILYGQHPAVIDWIQTRPHYAAGLVAAAGLLLEEANATAFASQILRALNQNNSGFFQIIESAGRRLAIPGSAENLRGLLQSGFRAPVAHRLVIVDDFRDINAVASLFYGARSVTVMVLGDLFGKADVARFIGREGIENITVEHVRTRITRFSDTYIKNHEATRDAAQMIGAALQAFPQVLDPAYTPYVDLAVADFLHFECLKIAALENLLSDVSFDHIVVGTGMHQANSAYFQLLSGVRGLAQDPRVEMVCIARATAPRTSYAASLAAVSRRPARLPAPQLPWDFYKQLVDTEIGQQATNLAARLTLNPEKRGAVTVLFTANNAAYNEATANYMAALAKDNAVSVVHIGLQANPLLDAMAELAQNDGLASVVINPLPGQLTTHWDTTLRWLESLILTTHSKTPDSHVTHVIQISATRIANVVATQLVLAQTFERWFSDLAKTNSLPDLVVISPNRTPMVAAAAVAARRHGVVSLALEAHAIDGNYCRYIKVMTDYYGVVANYFRSSAAVGFDIPQDRIAVIGSPRLLAPPNHDPESARTLARAELSRAAPDQGDLDRGEGHMFAAQAGTVSFFGQPSSWAHVTLVWRNILMAAQTLNLGVLLKPHPEEAPSRIDAYLAQAAALGAADIVQLVQGPPGPVIDASDVVLTAYSTAAVDAAVRQVPVICVTDGDVNYPLDQHRIVDAPFVRTAAELQKELALILTDRPAARARMRAFLQRESQFIDGPEERLRHMVLDILGRPTAQHLRPDTTLGAPVFLDGPHPRFAV